jgi:general secretion pathway protein D
VPTASGSFQPGIGGVGINPLVNTQFQYIDVGVNVDITPKIHSSEEVSLHVEIDVSNVRDRVDIGGIEQPVIGQRKLAFDVRMREGEVNLIGGLMQHQETKTITGVPGLSSIPVIRRLFTSEGIEKSDSELLIALIPRIVRGPEFTRENLKGVAVGNATVVKLNYVRPRTAASEAPATQPAAPEAQPAEVPAPAPAPAVPSPEPPPATAPPIPGVTTPPLEAPKPEAATQPGQPLRLTFSPASVVTQAEGTFTLNIGIDNATDLFSTPLQIKFDPKMLRLVDVTRGNLLSQDGQQVVFTRNIMNDTGDATVNLNRFPGTGGVSGSGTLATLTFQATGKGTTSVTLPGFTPRNSQLQPVPAITPPLVVQIN